MKKSYLNDINLLLKSNKIRPTEIRRQILNVFIGVNYALSHADIVKNLKGNTDRVTIYRTLEKFEQKGLIHKIVDHEGITRFASHGLGGCDINFKHHKRNHLHFRCTECGNIYCMCSVQVPEINVPEGFKLKSLNLLAEGICEKCTQEQKYTVTNQAETY